MSANLVDSYQEGLLKEHHNVDEEMDDSEILDLLDDEETFEGYREKRKQELAELYVGFLVILRCGVERD
jgi:hypothetical protein